MAHNHQDRGGSGDRNQLSFGSMIVRKHTDGEAADESAFERDALSRPIRTDAL